MRAAAEALRRKLFLKRKCHQPAANLALQYLEAGGPKVPADPCRTQDASLPFAAFGGGRPKMIADQADCCNSQCLASSITRR